MIRGVVIAALLSLTGCTSAEVAWWTSTIAEADSSGARCPDLAPALELFGLPAGFDTIVYRESRCDPTAVNRDSGALGLTQIMPMWLDDLCRAGIACTRAEMLDAHTNLAAAAYVFDLQGWDAWSTTRP